MVQYLIPSLSFSETIAKLFKETIKPFMDNDLQKVIDYCSILEVFKGKNNVLITTLVDVANELCGKFKVSREDLLNLFSCDFVYNLGLKSGTAGEPFPQDVEKANLITTLLAEKGIHPQVSRFLSSTLEKVKRDIEE